jgi:hypothetical protein
VLPSLSGARGSPRGAFLLNRLWMLSGFPLMHFSVTLPEARLTGISELLLTQGKRVYDATLQGCEP